MNDQGLLRQQTQKISECLTWKVTVHEAQIQLAIYEDIKLATSLPGSVVMCWTRDSSYSSSVTLTFVQRIDERPLLQVSSHNKRQVQSLLVVKRLSSSQYMNARGCIKIHL